MGREEGSGWGTCVYLWQIHVDIWQNQYNIVKLKNKNKSQKVNEKKKKKYCSSPSVLNYLYKATKWSDIGESVCLKSHCYWSERVLVVDAEHHLMHISLEPTRSLASTTNFFFLSWAAANSENTWLSARCDERQSTCFSERWGWNISPY